MINLQEKKYSDYLRDGDAHAIDEILREYRQASTAKESGTVEDLEKHLWLANGAAASVAIGYIQAIDNVGRLQLYGAWAFVAGILSLVILKYVSHIMTSRDRYRFQDAKSRFDANEVTDLVFRAVRDRTFRWLKRFYWFLQYSAGALFVLGCISTLAGVSVAQ